MKTIEDFAEALSQAGMNKEAIFAYLDRVDDSISKYEQNGKSREDIIHYIDGMYDSIGTSRPDEKKGMLDQFFTGEFFAQFANATAQGWGDELITKAMPYIEKVTTGSGKPESYWRGFLDNRSAEFGQANPKTQTALQIAGGVAPIVATGGVGAPIRGLAGIGGAALGGSTAGGIAGAGYADEGEKLEGGATGAAAGAVLGPIAHVAINNVITPFVRYIASRLGIGNDEGAIRRLMRMADEQGVDLEAEAAKLAKENQGIANPAERSVLGEFLGGSGARELRDIVETAGPERRLVQETFAAQEGAVPGQTSRAVDSSTGESAADFAARKAAQEKAAKDAADLYRRGGKYPVRNQATRDEYLAFLKTDNGKSIYNDLRRGSEAASQLKSGDPLRRRLMPAYDDVLADQPGSRLNANEIDLIYQEMKSRAARGGRSFREEQALAKNARDASDIERPKVAKARTMLSESELMDEGTNAGTKFYSAPRIEEEIINFNKMPPKWQEGFKDGFAKVLRERATKDGPEGIMKDPLMMQKMKFLFPAGAEMLEEFVTKQAGRAKFRDVVLPKVPPKSSAPQFPTSVADLRNRMIRSRDKPSDKKLTGKMLLTDHNEIQRLIERTRVARARPTNRALGVGALGGETEENRSLFDRIYDDAIGG